MAVETINDSIATALNEVETDDIRSFGFRAYFYLHDWALGLCYDGFTFRGDGSVDAMRSDELSLSAALHLPMLESEVATLRLGFGGGLRAWGDFGYQAIQELWHSMLGVIRPYPTIQTDSFFRPFCYASLDAKVAFPAAISLELAVHELVIGSGGLESSIAVFAARCDGASVNRIGISRQDRKGYFDNNDDLVAGYEEGWWFVCSAETGLFSIENALNLNTNFALAILSLRFGDFRAASGADGLRQELILGASLIEPALSTARFIVFEPGIELHTGIEAVSGGSRFVWDEIGCPHYQEIALSAEVFAKGFPSIARFAPFAGLAAGLRQDNLVSADLRRSELIQRSLGFIARIYAGIRLIDMPLPFEPGGRLALDFVLRCEVAVGCPIPPLSVTPFVRICALD